MKNSLIKSVIILIIGGFITKILGMIIKIVMTRSITAYTLGTYMMITPTLLLIINLSSFGIPTAISKLVSDKNYNNKKIILSNISIELIINITIMITIFIIAPYLSNNLLNNKDLYLGIIFIALLIPFTTISSIIKSYLFGKNKVLPITLSNILEQISKLLIYIYYLPIIKYKSTKYIIVFLIITNIITEIISIFTLLLFVPKNIEIRKRDFIPNFYYIKSSLSISIPNTASSLISSIGMFLEPIILNNHLKYIGYTSKYITYNYGIINGYVIPLILLPSFFNTSISSVLLPSISKDYSNNNIKNVKRKLKLSIFLTILISLSITIVIILIPKLLLRFIYHTELGVNYLRILSPIFFIYYLSLPLQVTLEAIGKSKINLKCTIFSNLIRISTLFILSFFRIGFYSLIISTYLNIIYTFFYLYFKTSKYLS